MTAQRFSLMAALRYHSLPLPRAKSQASKVTLHSLQRRDVPASFCSTFGGDVVPHYPRQDNRKGDVKGDIKNTTLADGDTSRGSSFLTAHITTAQGARPARVYISGYPARSFPPLHSPPLHVELMSFNIFPRRHADNYGRGQRSRHGQHLRGILRSTTPHIPM